MLWKRVNQSLPEQAFIVVENNEGAAFVKDQTVQWDLTSDVDGVKARDMDTGNLHSFIGIVDAAFADGEFGLVQVFGYRSTSIVFQTGTSQDTGALLTPVAAADYLSSVASTTASNAAVTFQPAYAVLGETIASSSASATISAKVFLRAL